MRRPLPCPRPHHALSLRRDLRQMSVLSARKPRFGANREAGAYARIVRGCARERGKAARTATYTGEVTAYVSAFDLFSIGIGPSSSHTVGPLRAAAAFASRLDDAGMLDRVDQVTCALYGSLGSTGIGHGTPDAVIAGLRGLQPETCRPEDVRGAWADLAPGATLQLAGR